MQYGQVREGRFLSRPNRFIAHVAIDGADTVVHVKNTGRCRELLVPGATVYCGLRVVIAKYRRVMNGLYETL